MTQAPMLGEEITEDSKNWVNKHVYDQVHWLYNTNLLHPRSDVFSIWFVKGSFDEVLDSTCQVLYNP